MSSTRRTRKNRRVEEVHEKSWSEETYDRFLKEGAVLFKYMVDNFEDMVDGEMVKHFTIREICNSRMDTEELNKMYNIDIEKELYPWIKNELKDGRLFETDFWRPVRDSYFFTSMYLGYRKMFQFKQYYFQLIIEIGCDYEDCTYCKKNDDLDTYIHFEIVLYGWKDDKYEKLQPNNRIVIPSDYMIPDWYWNRK